MKHLYINDAVFTNFLPRVHCFSLHFDISICFNYLWLTVPAKTTCTIQGQCGEGGRISCGLNPWWCIVFCTHARPSEMKVPTLTRNWTNDTVTYAFLCYYKLIQRCIFVIKCNGYLSFTYAVAGSIESVCLLFFVALF